MVTSTEAVRWDQDDFPLRFRILDTGRLPDYGGLDDAKWREIVRRGFHAWSTVETADISIVIEDAPLVADRADTSDGINTIGFEVLEERGEYRASASVLDEGGRRVGCDIHFEPTLFDDWPDDDPAVEAWAAHFLEEIVMHEMGHCLGLWHVPANPVWLGQARNEPEWLPGFLPEPLRGLSPDPQMSVAASYGVPRLMPDDRIGVSLLYPAPGFLRERGSVAGRVTLGGGEPAAHVHVQAVDHASGTAVFGPGAFTNERGEYRVGGLPPGPVHLWIRPARHSPERVLHGRIGTTDILDEHRWSSVRAGALTIVPDIVVTSGRIPP